MSDVADIQLAILQRHYLARKRMEELPVNWCPDDDPPGERPTSMQEVTDLTPFIRSMQEWLAAHDASVRAHTLEEAETAIADLIDPSGDPMQAPDVFFINAGLANAVDAIHDLRAANIREAGTNADPR